MKSFITTILSVAACFSLVACAHTHTVSGPQERTELPAGIRVAIGSSEIKEGDKVRVYSSYCHKEPGEPGERRKNECHNKTEGTALVLKVLDHDSAIVEPLDNLKIEASMKVEKQ